MKRRRRIRNKNSKKEKTISKRKCESKNGESSPESIAIDEEEVSKLICSSRLDDEFFFSNFRKGY